MSEITRGVISMPFELAMETELGRRQFHAIAQELLAKNEQAELIGRLAYNFDGYKAVLDERDDLRAQVAGLKTGYEAYERENAELRKIISESAAACGAAVSVQCSPEFMAMLPSEIGSVVGGLRKDAKRYRFLRNQHWPVAYLAVVVNPKVSVKLGHDCPSGERLDEQVDGAMKRETGHD